MKTIELKLFEYSELPTEKAKEKAREWFNKDGVNCEYIYSDARETVKAFFKHFPGSEGRNSWLDISTNNINDNILGLSGQRLATYIYNNFGDVLFKGKYFSGLPGAYDTKLIHPCVKNWEIKQGPNKGKFGRSYYSRITKENCCVLTGVCYDDDLLGPIYDFLKAPDNTNFEDLLNNCFEALRKSVEDEVEYRIEYRNSREAIEEDIEANEYTFLEDGTRFE